MRLLLSCGDTAFTDQFQLGHTLTAESAALVDAIAEEEPTFLVLVLRGVSITSQAQDTPGLGTSPRLSGAGNAIGADSYLGQHNAALPNTPHIADSICYHYYGHFQAPSSSYVAA